MDGKLPKEDENSAKADFEVSPESGLGEGAANWHPDKFLGGSSKRTFKIEGVQPAKEPVASRKRFEIHGQSPKEPRKLFKIEGDRVPVQLPRTNREIMFARQRNTYDCGPCLVLNTLQALGVNSGLSGVPDVRSYANQLRIAAKEQRRTSPPKKFEVISGLPTVSDEQRKKTLEEYLATDPTLPDNGWFTDIDMDKVLQAQGLNVRSWSANDEGSRRRLKDYTEELARGGQEFVVYTGSGRHYKGLYRNRENGIFELDSLKPNIPRVGGAAIETMIARAAQSDRIESISVASLPPTTQQ